MEIKDPLGVFKYKIVRTFSYLLRCLFCFLAIEQVPIFESETAQWIYSAFFGGVLYSLLWGICYPVVRHISRVNGIKSSAVKSGMYFVFYIPLAIIAFIILFVLTECEILPISKEITFNMFEWLEQKCKELMNWLFGLIFKAIVWITETASENLS